jgi:RalA-binding protein 1
VEMLVRYYTGTYSEELIFNPSSGLTSIQNNSLAVSSQQSGAIGQPRSSTSSNDVSNSSASRAKASVVPREDSKGAVQLPPDIANVKLYPSEDYTRSSSPSKSLDSLPTDRQGAPLGGGQDPHTRVMDRGLGLPSSLPDSPHLSSTPVFQPDANTASHRANSELGHYSDSNQRQNSPEWYRNRDAHDGRKPFYSSLGTVAPSPTTVMPPAPPERVPSPEKLDANSKVKISGPMNGAPIPSGFKFGGSSSDVTAASNDRREKAKSRSFWGFGKASGEDLFLFINVVMDDNELLQATNRISLFMFRVPSLVCLWKRLSKSHKCVICLQLCFVRYSISKLIRQIKRRVSIGSAGVPP